MRTATKFLSLLLLLAGCAKHAGVVALPRPSGPIDLDGETKEPDWNARALRTGAFVDDQGKIARPYSEARLMADDELLYVTLYAADADIRSTDCFQLDALQLCAGGAASDPRIKLGVDRDGTLDDPSGSDDEEWIVEAAIPRELAPSPIRISRCDVLKSGETRCGHTAVKTR